MLRFYQQLLLPGLTSAAGCTDYGADIWADFVEAMLQRLRRGARLAIKLAPMVDELIVTCQLLVLRRNDAHAG